MKTPNPQDNEIQRLIALKQYSILDTPTDEKFDDLTKLASHICDTPIALITLVDEARQWFKSNIGLDVSEMPRNISFCGHAILTKELFEVTNALDDERFKDNPLVIGSPHIRFYAGIPLITNEGYCLGTLCVIDTKPRHLTPEQAKSLQMLGRQVLSQIECHLSSLKLIQVNHELTKKSMFYDTLLQSTNESIITTDIFGVITSFNLGAERMLGYRADELIGKTTYLMIHDSEEVHKYTAELRETLGCETQTEYEVFVIKASNGQSDAHEWTYICKDESRITVSLTMTAMYQKDNTLLGFLGIARDITASKINQIKLDSLNQSLSKSNNMLTQVTNAMPAMVAYWDADLRCKFVNKSYIDWFGKHPSELIGTYIQDLLGERLFNMNERYIRGALAGEKQTFERTLTKSDGTTSYTLANYIPDVSVNGEVNGFYVLVSDITAIKSAEANLKLAATFFQSTSEGILITDADSVILSVNPAFTEITGYDAEDVIAQNARLLKSTRHDKEFYANLRQSINTIGDWHGEIWNKHKNGDDYLVLMNINRVTVNDENKTNYVATLVDITEKKLQEQKRLDDEILHRDLLVSEVHHRIKNNLQGVAGLLRNFTLDNPEFTLLINEVISQVYTISFIHGLQGKSAISSVRLCELTSEIAANNKSLYGTPILIDIPTFWTPCRIRETEAVPLALVLNELISNAIKYGDKIIGVNISLRFESLTGKVIITISNGGQLPAGFEDRSFTIQGKGLQLVTSLLPKKGANLSWEQHGEFVYVILELESPVFILESEKLENYDAFKI